MNLIQRAQFASVCGCKDEKVTCEVIFHGHQETNGCTIIIVSWTHLTTIMFIELVKMAAPNISEREEVVGGNRHAFAVF